MGKYPSPKYLLGALVTDGAPDRLSLRLAEGYAAALRDLQGDELHLWLTTTQKTCLSRGWLEASIALLCAPSEERTPYYLEQAERLLDRKEG